MQVRIIQLLLIAFLFTPLHRGDAQAWDRENVVRSFPLDFNRDGVMDAVWEEHIDEWWSVEFFGTTAYRLVSLGPTRVLGTGNELDWVPVVFEAGQMVGFAPAADQGWRSRYSTVAVATYSGFMNDILEFSATGAFGSQRSRYIVLQVTGVDGPQLAWLEILSGPTSITRGADGIQPVVNTPVTIGESLPVPPDPHRVVLDSDGDGVIDAVVERHWRRKDEGSATLNSISVWPRNGRSVLITTHNPGGVPPVALLHDWEGNGDPTGISVPGQYLASAAERTLTSPSPPAPQDWSADGPLVALIEDPTSGERGGILTEGRPVWVPLRISVEQATSFLLNTNGAILWAGSANAGFQMVGEMPRGEVFQRLDFNEDGLVDGIVFASGPWGWPRYYYYEALELLEPELVDAVPLFKGDFYLANQVRLGQPAPAPALDYQPSPDAVVPLNLLLVETFYEPVTGRLVSGGFFPGQYAILRVRKTDGWHMGWMGFVERRVEFWVEPEPGQPAHAGLYYPPTVPPLLQYELTGTQLKLSWDPRFVGYQLEQRGLLSGDSWEPASGMVSRGAGFVELQRVLPPKLFRLQPTF